MLNKDMILECLQEFDKNTELNSCIKETNISTFVVKINSASYVFKWDGQYIPDSDESSFNYVGSELERYFKAKLNSLNNSNVEAPNHYTLPSGKQLIELLQSDLLTRKEFIGFCKGNIYKYVSRYQSKNHREDLEKAKQYLTFLEGLEDGRNEKE